MGQGRSVFFLVNTIGLFDELFRLAKLLRSNDIEPLFYFTFPHWTVERDIERCRVAEIQVIRDDPLDPAAMFRGLRRIRDFLARRSSWPLATFLSEFLEETIGLRLSLARAAKLLSLTDSRLLILSFDLVGYDSAAFVKAAHLQGKKVLIVTTTMSKGIEVAEFFYRNPKFHVVDALSRIIARLFPKWVLSHRGRNLLRVPPARILAMEMLRLVPPKPWLFNSSRADAIIMESHALANYSEIAGMPREQMRVVGSTADDVLSETLANREFRRNDLCRSLGLPADRPIILTALPPDFLYVAGGRPECDFPDYDSLVEFWVVSLSAVQGYNVVISLHPSAKPEEMRALERHGARISTLLTPELIPLCDVFVASVSSTIRWAIACGKPVVDYDIYRYCYTGDFENAGGVVSVADQGDFNAILSRLANDKGFFAELQTRQRAISKHWGFLDGKCGERMAAVVNEMLSRIRDP
jgi:glycosyltransferase involved in cell wall biosynthesis